MHCPLIPTHYQHPAFSRISFLPFTMSILQLSAYLFVLLLTCLPSHFLMPLLPTLSLLPSVEASFTKYLITFLLFAVTLMCC